MYPCSETEMSKELTVRKTYFFLSQNNQYQILGEVMALAKELKCIPKVEWFYAELTLTLPPTSTAATIANYMNDQEVQRCGLRNQSKGTSVSPFHWSPEMLRRIQTQSDENFCWCLTMDQRKTERFLQDILLQWHHRADYLIARKSRERKEFRQDVTLSQVILQGQERKRRMQQRKLKEEQREQDIKEKKVSEWDNFVHDVLPREVREHLDRESDGMDDFTFARTGLSTGRGKRAFGMR